MPSRSLIAALAAETIGTYLFFVLGAGTIIVDIITGNSIGILGIALVHGLALAVLATAFGAISAAQFNPAVTVALWLIGKVRTIEGLRFIAAQLIGATLAGLTLKLAFLGVQSPSVYDYALGGSPVLGAGLDAVQGIVVEAILTALLVYAVLMTAVDARAPKMGGLFIGLAVTADIIVGGPLTGAAMNPARWFGPAVVYGDLSQAVVYIAGPLIGATLAALSVRYLFAQR
jgi:aquaporin Z